MEVGDALVSVFQEMDGLIEIGEEAWISFGVPDSTTKDLREEKSKGILHGVTADIINREANAAFLDAMQVPLVEMLHFHLQGRERHEEGF